MQLFRDPFHKKYFDVRSGNLLREWADWAVPDFSKGRVLSFDLANYSCVEMGEAGGEIIEAEVVLKQHPNWLA